METLHDTNEPVLKQLAELIMCNEMPFRLFLEHGGYLILDRRTLAATVITFNGASREALYPVGWALPGRVYAAGALGHRDLLPDYHRVELASGTTLVMPPRQDHIGGPKLLGSFLCN